MALNATDENKSNGLLYILKIKSKDTEGKPTDIHFQVSEKVEGKWLATKETKNISGDLVSVDITEEEYNKEPYHAIKIRLEDVEAKEQYLIDARFTMVTRSLLNSLFSLNSHKDLKIGLYKAKGKEGKGEYDSVSLRQGGEKVSWKYSIAELPKIEQIVTKAKTINVYDNLNDFYIEKTKELSVKLKEWRKTGAKAPVAEKAVEPTPAAPENDDPTTDF